MTKHNKDHAYYGNLPSNYLINLGKEQFKKHLDSQDIKQDAEGNCTVMGQKIEANACSMVKDNYRK